MRDLNAELLRNVGGVHVSTRMSRLDVWRAVTLFLQLSHRENLHLPGDYPVLLGFSMMVQMLMCMPRKVVLVSA